MNAKRYESALTWAGLYDVAFTQRIGGYMIRWLLEFIPMFRTEAFAMNVEGDSAEYVCNLRDLEEDDEFTHVMEVSSLCFLFQRFFPVTEGLIKKDDY